MGPTENTARAIARSLIRFLFFRCALIAGLLIATALALGFPATRHTPHATRIGTPTAIEAAHHSYCRGHSGHSTLWVQETLTADSNATRVVRSGSFHQDPEQPKEFRWSEADYAGSGYDIGHLAAAADARGSKLRQREVSLITNTAPQSPELNRGQWARLESHVRTRGVPGDTIVTGTAFLPAADGVIRIKTIGPRKLRVPTHFWKAAYFAREAKAEAWLIPNRGVDDYHKFAISVDALEAAIGLDLFPGVDETLEAKQ